MTHFNVDYSFLSTAKLIISKTKKQFVVFCIFNSLCHKKY
jgi:hypothetical protein